MNQHFSNETRIVEYRVVTFEIVNTPVELLERIADYARKKSHWLAEIAATHGVEIVTMATCNRVEFYFAIEDENERISNGNLQQSFPPPSQQVHPLQTIVSTLFSHIATFYAVPIIELEKCAQIFSGKDAICHLFRTVAGLNSIAIGETQIQGQVKDAFQAALQLKRARSVLIALFEAALRAGKRARTESGIQNAHISLGSLALDSLRKANAFSQVVIVGTGKMAKNAAEFILRYGMCRELVFLSRHPEKRADQLSRFNAEVKPLDMLPEFLHSADLVFSAYGTKELFITPSNLKPMLQKRSKPLYLIDIALPRDIDPAVKHLPDVRFIDFAELQKMKNQHPLLVNGEIAEAEKIVEEEIQDFSKELQLRKATTSIAKFRLRAESQLHSELDGVFKKFSHLKAPEQEVIEKLTNNIINKILNQPTVRVREKARAGELSSKDYNLIAELFTT